MPKPSAAPSESRARFEKAFAAKYYTADPIAKETMADLWEQAERDTREQCAQQIDEIYQIAKRTTPPYAASALVRILELAERIRGKE